MSNPKNKVKTQPIAMKKLSPVSMVTELPPVRGNLRTSSSSPTKAIHNEKDTTSAIDACVDRAFRIPIFLSTTNTVNDLQEQFLTRLIREIEDALLFPRTLPVSEQYPENILTNIRRLVFSSYGLLAINFRRFFVQILESNVGEPPTTTPFWEGSTFSQIEPAMAFQFGIPILLVREKGTDVSNGIWAGGITPLNIFVDWDSDNQSVDDFFNSVQWREVFAYWAAEVRGNYLLRTEPLFNN
ncbi:MULTISPECIES: hypothetical protein [Paenibacillus]|uniref:Uncharacterized protein n=1 Tax=Paenibacillus pabuli TaxID=1472 RepID=A0A855Y226_9BACL|nr:MULTISPECIES: hypothetical protein [Paenibacillus]PWW33722.1 hypothetical protein DET56_11771 [Paenibacillus pabuli]PXV99992.1 hypothetical protein DEU73_11670 [Paenibacillus taichungensis]RAI86881.1 hypothetical protein DET54_11872 [Paenibacillus pabuli]